MCTPIPSVASRFTSASSTTLQFLHPAVGEPTHTRSHGTGLFISQPANHMMDPTTSIKNATWEGGSTGQSPTRTQGPGRDALSKAADTNVYGCPGDNGTGVCTETVIPPLGVPALMRTFHLIRMADQLEVPYIVLNTRDRLCWI